MTLRNFIMNGFGADILAKIEKQNVNLAVNLKYITTSKSCV